MNIRTLIPMVLLALTATACVTHHNVGSTQAMKLGRIEQTTFKSPHDNFIVELELDDEGYLIGYVWDGTEETVDTYQFPKRLEAVQFTGGFSLEDDLVLTGLYTTVGAEAVITINKRGFDYHEVTPVYANWDE